MIECRAMILVVWHIRSRVLPQLFESVKAGQDLLERYRVVADTYDWDSGSPDALLLHSPSCERITGYPPKNRPDPRLI